jgi:DNA-binding MarR family transcriptional regulator
VKKEKLQISAKEVLDDLRSGMDDKTFMGKYKLSYRQLQDLFRKMIKAGFVSPIELAERLCVTSSQVTEVIKQVEKSVKELD